MTSHTPVTMTSHTPVTMTSHTPVTYPRHYDVTMTSVPGSCPLRRITSGSSSTCRIWQGQKRWAPTYIRGCQTYPGLSNISGVYKHIRGLQTYPNETQEFERTPDIHPLVPRISIPSYPGYPPPRFSDIHPLVPLVPRIVLRIFMNPPHHFSFLAHLFKYDTNNLSTKTSLSTMTSLTLYYNIANSSTMPSLTSLLCLP